MYDALACQTGKVKDGAALREGVANRLATSTHPPALYKATENLAKYNPKALRQAGNIGMHLHTMQRRDPHSSKNQSILVNKDPEYAALREQLKEAAQAGDQAQKQVLETQCREIETAKALKVRRETERQALADLGEDIFYFSGGFFNAVNSNLTLGAIPREHLSRTAFVNGQLVGDGLSLGMGAVESWLGRGMMGGGSAVMIASGGVLVPIAVPVASGGVAFTTHGSLVMSKALLEFSKSKEKRKHEGRKSNTSGKETHKSNVQHKKLSEGEIKKLKDNGYDIHSLKGDKRASKFDLYKDSQRNIFVKLKGGKGHGEPLGINLDESG